MYDLLSLIELNRQEAERQLEKKASMEAVNADLRRQICALQAEVLALKSEKGEAKKVP